LEGVSKGHPSLFAAVLILTGLPDIVLYTILADLADSIIVAFFNFLMNNISD
jgi:hypothetical protein